MSRFSTFHIQIYAMASGTEPQLWKEKVWSLYADYTAMQSDLIYSFNTVLYHNTILRHI
jgi:hypothetical protein